MFILYNPPTLRSRVYGVCEHSIPFCFPVVSPSNGCFQGGSGSSRNTIIRVRIACGTLLEHSSHPRICLKSLTHIGRSEIPGHKLFGWDPTWGTCLEQSLFKINPRRLKMKKRFLVFLWLLQLGWSNEIEKSIRKKLRARFFVGQVISRESPEVSFCSWT